MKKSVLSCLLAAVLLFGIAGCGNSSGPDIPPPAYTPNPASDFTYEITGDKVTITSYTGESGLMAVPSAIDGKEVTELAASAFNKNKIITEVLLPDSITVIADSCFMACSNLARITLPPGLTRIEAGAFGGCALEEVEFPETLEFLDFACFYYNEELTAAIFNGDAPEIGETGWVFSNCGSDFTVYYHPDKNGWADKWQGYNALPISEKP
ncbi:MAG: leucine-rich repeat domain-containing protein [Oscillospiraceae bacterium]|nr:leucine-rich repeat domain-containing protein [Oscillospiraceae bacterium]